MTLPKTPIKGDAETRRFLEAIRQELLRTAGQMVTIEDMRRNGFFETNGIPLDFTDPTIDTPSAPTNLAASGSFRTIIITWDYTDYVGHSHSRIYRSLTNDYSTAEILANIDGRVYSDNVGSDKSYYYWVSNVNLNNIESATSQTSGVNATTPQDTDFLLDSLTNSITNSELSTALESRITDIEVYTDTIQSQINEILAIDEYDNSTAYAADDQVVYNDNLYRATQSTTGNLPTDTNYWQLLGQYTSLGELVGDNTAAITAINTISSGSSSSSAQAISALQSTVNDSETGVSATAALASLLKTEVFPDGTSQASSIDTLQSTVDNSETGVSATATLAALLKGEVFPDGTSQASSIDTLQSTVNNLETGVSATATLASSLEAEVFPNGTSQASSIDTLSTTVGGNTASIESQATSINGLSGQYTVKVDINGNVSGFGLASTANNSTPTSEFTVRADSFSISNPSGSGIPDATPFIVRTTPTTINGVSVPVGIYMSDAVVQNGSIVNAKIGNAAIDDAKISSLSAEKITTGFLDASRISVDGVGIDSYYDATLGRNRLYIRDLGVSNAKIDDLTIGTEKIQDLAITRSSSFFLDFLGWSYSTKSVWYDVDDSYEGYYYVGPNQGSYTYVAYYQAFYFVGEGNGDYDYGPVFRALQASVTTSPTIASGQQGVDIDCNLTLERDGGSDDYVGARCVRTNDGAVIGSYNSLRVRNGKSTYALFFLDANPIAGATNTYQIQAYNNNDNSHFHECSVRVTLFRK